MPSEYTPIKPWLLTSRITGDALNSLSRDDAQMYFWCWYGDLKAAYRLNVLCEHLHEAGNMEGAALLWDAFSYLSDRESYRIEIERRGIPNGRNAEESHV